LFSSKLRFAAKVEEIAMDSGHFVVFIGFLPDNYSMTIDYQTINKENNIYFIHFR